MGRFVNDDCIAPKLETYFLEILIILTAKNQPKLNKFDSRQYSMSPEEIA